MAFPLSPSNLDEYTNNLGTVYQYIAADTKWIIKSQVVTGATGLQGVTGLAGTIGIDGVTGLQGVTGLEGIATSLYGSTGMPAATGLQEGTIFSRYYSEFSNNFYPLVDPGLTGGIKLGFCESKISERQYYTDYTDKKIYTRENPTAAWVDVGATGIGWGAMAAAPNGDIYVAGVGTSYIYKQAGGTGAFVDIGAPARTYGGLTVAPNGNLYACASDDIYWSPDGVAGLTGLQQGSMGYRRMAADSKGNIYATYGNGDILKRWGGLGNFTGMQQPELDYGGICVDSKDDMYVGVFSNNVNVYKMSKCKGLLQLVGDYSGGGVKYGGTYGIEALSNGDLIFTVFNVSAGGKYQYLTSYTPGTRVVAGGVWRTVDTKDDFGAQGVTGLRGLTGAQGVTGMAPAGGGLPVGMVVPFAGSSAPTGFLLCDGAQVSTTTYADLYSVIGTTYGSGSGTFGVPNLKGRVIAGYDSGNANFNSMGETGGAETHTLTTAQMPSHTHTINRWGTGTEYTGHFAYGGNAGQSTDGTSNSAGSGGAHNNLQPYITLNYIIKY